MKNILTISLLTAFVTLALNQQIEAKPSGSTSSSNSRSSTSSSPQSNRSDTTLKEPTHEDKPNAVNHQEKSKNQSIPVNHPQVTISTAAPHIAHTHNSRFVINNQRPQLKRRPIIIQRPINRNYYRTNFYQNSYTTSVGVIDNISANQFTFQGNNSGFIHYDVGTMFAPNRAVVLKRKRNVRLTRRNRSGNYAIKVESLDR